MKFLSALYNTCLYLALSLIASVSFCMHLLYEISETGDTDRFHLITHCKLINYKF